MGHLSRHAVCTVLFTHQLLADEELSDWRCWRGHRSQSSKGEHGICTLAQGLCGLGPSACCGLECSAVGRALAQLRGGAVRLLPAGPRVGSQNRAGGRASLGRVTREAAHTGLLLVSCSAVAF